MTTMSRRTFLKGCSAAIAALSGSTLHSAVFGNPADEPNQEILITVFLRGGMDVLNFVPPLGGDDRGYYEAARPALQLPAAELLPLGNSAFGLHPAAAALHQLFGDGKLAIVQATGMHEDTRSHFEAMQFIEYGTPGDSSTASGWIARHLSSAPNLPETIVMPAVAAGNSTPNALIGSNEVIAMNSNANFTLDGLWRYRDPQRLALRRLYARSLSAVHVAGVQALDAGALIELNAGAAYTPLPGVTYPGGTFGDHLRLIAQLIKLELGLRTATVDLGGWDTHDNQGSGSGGYFAGLLATLADGLAAFYNDLNTSQRAPYTDRVTVVVMSEFGRRLRQNADNGSDHGHGGAMVVLGGKVNGGLYGTWPGLRSDQLYQGADLAVTTDYRRVLSELLIRRLGNPHLGIVFPGYTNYAPLGIVQGEDLVPIYDAVPTARSLDGIMTDSGSVRALAAAAGIGLAATAGLVALRQRGQQE